MHGHSWHCPTIRWSPPPVSLLAGRRDVRGQGLGASGQQNNGSIVSSSAGRVGIAHRLLPFHFFLLPFSFCLLFLVGCESVEKVDVSRPLPPQLSPPELLRITKATWEDALADFYRDDWARMQEQVGRMNELATRWKAVAVPDDMKKTFDETVAQYESAVAATQAAVESKDVERTTDAMRHLGRRITAFDILR